MTRHGRAAWSCRTPTRSTGAEPELRSTSSNASGPIVEKALAENDRARWPIIVVHFDFKMVPPPLLHAVWDLLGEYQGWITTAAKTADPHTLTPFDPKPLLVLTEDADAQEKVFYDEVPVGGEAAPLRLGAHQGDSRPAEGGARPSARHAAAGGTAPGARDQLPPLVEQLLVRRRGGRPAQSRAMDRRRTTAACGRWSIMRTSSGYWIRFYTLDGFTAGESKGWDQSYNFGTREAATARWKAAIAAGVNLIATDQYEDFKAVMR